MSIIFSAIEFPINVDKETAAASYIKKLGLTNEQIADWNIHKISLDARKQDKIKFVMSLHLTLNSTQQELDFAEKFNNCTIVMNDKISPVLGTKKLSGKIVIAGFGPAGMFAGLTLAEYGYNPLIIERGDSVDERIRKVSRFWTNGILDTDSNVQFGEGGAGTFSDGKLTTRIKDPLCRHVLEKFVQFGGNSNILSTAKPHIGTDNLREIVKNIRQHIIELGGEIHFNTKLTGLSVKSGSIIGVSTNKTEEISTENLILAIGHSARDTFEMLLKNNILIEPKAFSIGARIEHTQESVDRSLYGLNFENPNLPHGEYQLSHQTDKRGVYSFCMCPGGMVVPSSSENHTVVTNGMSEYLRNCKNANAALVVTVTPKDFGNNPLDGLNFARDIEKKAYVLGGNSYSAPGCSVGSFLDGNASISKNSVLGSYSLGIVPVQFDHLFPKIITETMRKGIRNFSSKMDCFGDRNALLTAPETRTSSPIRITRNDDFQSITIKNLYPTGEGAGYAGGIISAAVDGIKIALKIMENFAP